MVICRGRRRGHAARDEAFRACRAVIESVKHNAPIWKRYTTLTATALERGLFALRSGGGQQLRPGPSFPPVLK